VLNLKGEIEKVFQVIHLTFTSSGTSVQYYFQEGKRIRTNQARSESTVLNLLMSSIKYRSAERDQVIKISLDRVDDYKVIDNCLVLI